MGKEILKFGNTEVEKRKFDYRTNLLLLEVEDTQRNRYLTWFLQA